MDLLLSMCKFTHLAAAYRQSVGLRIHAPKDNNRRTNGSDSQLLTGGPSVVYLAESPGNNLHTPLNPTSPGA